MLLLAKFKIQISVNLLSILLSNGPCMAGSAIVMAPFCYYKLFICVLFVVYCGTNFYRVSSHYGIYGILQKERASRESCQSKRVNSAEYRYISFTARGIR